MIYVCFLRSYITFQIKYNGCLKSHFWTSFKLANFGNFLTANVIFDYLRGKRDIFPYCVPYSRYDTNQLNFLYSKTSISVLNRAELEMAIKECALSKVDMTMITESMSWLF